MTIDFDTREEVNTTTSMIEQALTLPVDPSIRQEVRKFGFEYEMLPPSQRDRYEGEPDNVETHMATWREESDVYYDSDDEEEDAEANERLRFIREYQRQHGNHAGLTPVGGPMDLINRAYSNGLIAENNRHSYHCDCDSCDYRRDDPLMTAQSDCTVAVEFVSRIIDLNNFDQAALDIQRWVEMMEYWDEDGGWMPDGSTSCGNHVHVSADGDENEGVWHGTTVRRNAHDHVNALYAAFDWVDIADGGCGKIRGYNSKPGRTNEYGGNWLSDRGYGTFEHRLWNTPREPRRLWAHIGISLGLQRWGFNIAQNMPDFTFWGTRENRYGDRIQSMTDEAYNAVTTNVGEIVRGIRAYIPQHDRFDIARDLIVNLTPA